MMANPRRIEHRAEEGDWVRLSEGPAELNPTVPEEYRPAAKLARKVALITGSDSGIGRSVAVLFAREGADIALVYPPEAQAHAESTRQEVDLSGGRCLLLPGDLSDDAFCRRAVDRCLRVLGRLDILVNGALCLPSLLENGSANGSRNGARNRSMDPGGRLEGAFQSDEFGCFSIVRAAVARLAPGSCIINAAPAPEHGFPPDSLGARATRGSMHAFTHKLAVALAADGIRVNCVEPAPARIGLPLPRPEVMAPSFVFLAANPDSRHITGEVVTVLGRRIG